MGLWLSLWGGYYAKDWGYVVVSELRALSLRAVVRDIARVLVNVIDAMLRLPQEAAMTQPAPVTVQQVPVSFFLIASAWIYSPFFLGPSCEADFFRSAWENCRGQRLLQRDDRPRLRQVHLVRARSRRNARESGASECALGADPCPAPPCARDLRRQCQFRHRRSRRSQSQQAVLSVPQRL
jgi:hypothetical protein